MIGVPRKVVVASVFRLDCLLFDGKCEFPAVAGRHPLALGQLGPSWWLRAIEDHTIISRSMEIMAELGYKGVES